MATSKSDSTTPLRIFIFDSTRLRSHLFFRYISTNSNVYPIYHPMLPAAMFGPEHLAQHLKHSEARQREPDEDMKPLYGPDTYKSAVADFEKRIAEAEKQSKIPVSNEHWFNIWRISVVLDMIRGKILTPDGLGRNPTCLPDHIFDTLTPIIMVRHPALSINSIYRDALQITKQRPGDEDFELITMNKPLRLFFDWYKQRGHQPIVVDAEDILTRPAEMIANVCKTLGVLRPSDFSETWEPTSKETIERMNPLVLMLTKNIHESRGIERPVEKPEEPDLDKTARQWSEKCGDAVAQQLLTLAEDNMPHYEYLKQYFA